MWEVVKTDTHGVYQIELPVGEYLVSAGYRRAKTDALEVVVESGRTVHIQPMHAVKPPLGVTTKAGPSRTKRVSKGFRQGSWLTLNVPDGLANPVVFCTVQDSNGDFWFGNSADGVSRFDGLEFATFDKDDGLAGNFVYSMLA